MIQILRATKIGRIARTFQRDSRGGWTVLASVSGAVYLESDADDLLWLTGRRSALHARAILLKEMPSSLPTRGAPCWFSGPYLHIGRELVVDLGRATVWHPALLTQVDDSLAERCDRLERAVRYAAPAASSNAWLAHALQLTGIRSRPDPEAALDPTASQGVAALQRVGSADELVRGLEVVEGLVGLGEGLTPSGDDFLGGFLYTLRVLTQVFPAAFRIDWGYIETWLRRVKPLTNKISHHMLVDHARGEAAEPLASLLQATLTGSSLARLTRLVIQLGRIGSSSGWDVIAGVYSASQAAERMLQRGADGDGRGCGDAACGSTGSQRQMRKEVMHVC